MPNNIHEPVEFTRAQRIRLARIMLEETLRSIPEATKKYRRHLANCMIALEYSDYEIAYRLGVKVEWVRKHFTNRNNDDSDAHWSTNIVDQRIFNGKVSLVDDFQLASMIAQTLGDGIRKGGKLNCNFIEAFLGEYLGLRISATRAWKIRRMADSIAHGRPVPKPVSKKETLNARRLAVRGRVLESMKKPNKINSTLDFCLLTPPNKPKL